MTANIEHRPHNLTGLPPLTRHAEQKFFDVPAIIGGATEEHRIGYLDWESDNPNAETLLCIHGLTRNSHDFDYIAAELSKDFRVICVDMAGRGISSWLEDKSGYNYITYVADIIALLDELKIEKVNWLGVSMGSLIAMVFATMTEGRINKLIINDIGNIVPADAMQRIVAYASVPHIFNSRNEAEDFLHSITKPFGITNPLHWKRFAEFSIWEINDGTFTLSCDPEILAPLMAETNNGTSIEDIDLRAFWQQVTCPVLLLRGEESDILPIDIAESMASQGNVELHQFAGVGHAPALMEDSQISVVKNWLLS